MPKKLTTEEFVAKAKAVHGDKYDYSRTQYVSSHIKVLIGCPKHGYFEQDPSSHLKGIDCCLCGYEKIANIKRADINSFITKSNSLHNNKYDYSKVNYINNQTKVIIICPKHGEFEQVPASHIRGSGCPKCAKITTEDFVAKAKIVHGDRYDYSETIYIGSDNKVVIICKEHGRFQQKVSNHIHGQGCKKCSNVMLSRIRRSTTKEFVDKSRLIHGNKYDYSKSLYINVRRELIIICPEHGAFEQTATSHLCGSGCPKCADDNLRSNSEDFIAKAKTVHNNRYDYSKVNYINNRTKVIIICPEHGEFEQVPSSHIEGCGCSRCANNCEPTLEEFIAKAAAVHENKYDYSKVNYINSQTKVIIICPEHGEFEQTASNHLRRSGCPKCGSNYRPTLEEFIARAAAVHENKYDYSKTQYHGMNNRVTITCPIHGSFQQVAGSHLRGHGCLKCAPISRAELIVEKYLKGHGYTYSSQIRFDTCKGIKQRLPFDFQVTLNTGLKILIEIDGDQHRHIVFNQKSFDHIQRTDAIKTAYCLANDIPLIRIEYRTIKWPEKDQIPYVIRQLEDALQRYDVLVESTVEQIA